MAWIEVEIEDYLEDVADQYLIKELADRGYNVINSEQIRIKRDKKQKLIELLELHATPSLDDVVEKIIDIYK